MLRPSASSVTVQPPLRAVVHCTEQHSQESSCSPSHPGGVHFLQHVDLPALQIEQPRPATASYRSSVCAWRAQGSCSFLLQRKALKVTDKPQLCAVVRCPSQQSSNGFALKMKCYEHLLQATASCSGAACQAALLHGIAMHEEHRQSHSLMLQISEQSSNVQLLLHAASQYRAGQAQSSLNFVPQRNA